MDKILLLVNGNITLFVIVSVCTCFSFIAIFLRFLLWVCLRDLYKNTKKLQNQLLSDHKLIQKLEKRFNQLDLEKVNVVVIIDHAYNEQKIWNWSYELIENFCSTLPNLLISFGLVGTFLGLTINLSNLIPTLGNINGNNLIDQLKEPLQGMAIAFVSSLVALLCAMFINLINLFFNTKRLKFQIFNYLEDYFENTYLAKNKTRLDKSIEKMTFQFDEFLKRFGSAVREVVEQAFQKPAQEILDANNQSREMAREIGIRFMDASGTITAGADRLKEAGELFKESNFPERLHSASQELQKAESNISALGDIMNAVNNSLIQTSTISDQVQNLIISNQKLQKISVDILQTINSERLALNTVISFGEEGLNTINTVVFQIQERLNHIEETVNLDEFAIALRNSNTLVEKMIELGNELSTQQNFQTTEFTNVKQEFQEFTKTFSSQIQELLKDIRSGSDSSNRLTNKIDKQTEELRNVNYSNQLTQQNQILLKLDKSVNQLVKFLEK